MVDGRLFITKPIEKKNDDNTNDYEANGKKVGSICKVRWEISNLTSKTTLVAAKHNQILVHSTGRCVSPAGRVYKKKLN